MMTEEWEVGEREKGKNKVSVHPDDQSDIRQHCVCVCVCECVCVCVCVWVCGCVCVCVCVCVW